MFFSVFFTGFLRHFAKFFSVFWDESSLEVVVLGDS